MPAPAPSHATLLLALVLHALPAAATLGGDEGSVEADRLALQATADRRDDPAGYRVVTLTLANGNHCREYLGSDSRVFAVAWDGPRPPDLSQLLGPAFFETYSDALRARREHRGTVSLRLPAFSIQARAGARAYAGSAWMPAALPAGVAASDLH